MIEKGKISAFQLALMIYPVITATAILVVPSITGKHAERDMWISPIWGALIGFFTTFIVYQLHKYYPKETFIQYSAHIIGTIPGKLLGFVYLFYFLHDMGTIVREYADFIISSFLPKTPLIVVLGSIVLVCGYAVRCGVEVLGRAAQLFTPIFIIVILILVILLFKDAETKNIFPILEHGVMPSIRGAYALQAWFCQSFYISMFLPYVMDSEKGMKWSMVSVLVVMLVMIGLNLLTVFLLGGTAFTTSRSYPIFVVIRYISISNFFEHLEAVIIVIWVTIMFIKIAVLYYVLVLSTAQWMNLSDYRSIVLPLGFLLTLLGLWVYRNMQEFSEYADKILPFYIPLLLTVIPTLLLLLAYIQNKYRKEKRSHTPIK